MQIVGFPMGWLKYWYLLGYILYLQIEYGDSKVTEAGSQHCSQALERFYPKKYTDPSEEGQRFVHIKL